MLSIQYIISDRTWSIQPTSDRNLSIQPTGDRTLSIQPTSDRTQPNSKYIFWLLYQNILIKMFPGVHQNCKNLFFQFCLINLFD